MSESQSPLVVNIDEFSEPERLETVFCSQMTEEEYEEQTATETQRALKDLMAYIEVNPDSYLNVVQRRKTEHLEEAGMMSFLKVKMLSMLNGGVYPGTALTEEQKTKCVSHLKVGMQRAFDYSQEAKGRRVSKRLMEKHAAALRAGRDENAAVPVAHIVPRTSGGTPPPPPPPPPPAELTPCRTPLANLRRPPLRDRNSQPSTPFPNSLPRPKSHVSRALGASESRGSTTSLASLTHELNSSNPMKRLRATAGPKSPGGTPSRSRKHRRGGSATSLHSTPSEEPLHLALMNILEQKFRNVRSPSPAGRFNNAMSPASASQNSFNQTGFTP